MLGSRAQQEATRRGIVSIVKHNQSTRRMMATFTIQRVLHRGLHQAAANKTGLHKRLAATVARAGVASTSPWRSHWGTNNWSNHRSSFHSNVLLLGLSGEPGTETINWAEKGKWKIFFGTQTGTANGFALQLQEELEGKGYDAEVIDLIEFDQKQIEDDTNHVFILSCYGAGEPTDSAKQFYDWILNSDNAAAPTIANKTFAVFGLGSSKGHCHNYNVVGRRIDSHLETLGGLRIFSRGEGDDSGCIELDFDEWQEKLLAHVEETKLSPGLINSFVNEATEAEGSQAQCIASTPRTAASSSEARCDTAKVGDKQSLVQEPKLTKYSIVWHQKDSSPSEAKQRLESVLRNFYPPNAHTFEVKDPRPLVPGFARSIREMRVVLGDPTLSYTTGDHIAVFPENPRDVVERYLRLYSEMDADVPLTLEINKQWNVGRTSAPSTADPILTMFGQYPVSLREALTHLVDLTSPPTPKAIKDIAAFATGSKDILLSMADRQNYTDAVTSCRRMMVDLLEDYHSQVNYPIERLLEILPRLQPRYYSIASSSLVSPRDCLVVYRHLQYTSTLNQERQGVCTTYLKSIETAVNNTDGTHSSGSVSAFLRQSDFKLPKDLKTPIIMIGGGTGIAPLRAFIEERVHLAEHGGIPASAFGPALLYFGARVPEELAYMDLIERAKSLGVLTSANIVFSHFGDRPRNLAEDLHSEAEAIWNLTFGKDPKSHVYVCGGAAGFGMSIANAIKDMFKQCGKYSDEQSAEWLRNAIEGRQYCEDLSD